MPNPQSIASCRGSFLKRPFFATAPFSTLKPVSLPTLSSRAKRGICCFFLLGFILIANSLSAQTLAERPRITGIAQVTLYSADLSTSRRFLEKLPTSRLSPCVGCSKIMNSGILLVNYAQSITFAPIPSPAPTNLLASVAFETDDVPELRRYLVSQGVECSQSTVKREADKVLSLRDPEGHVIKFVQVQRKSEFALHLEKEVQIIHAGFIVRDREKMEHFYKDILGFRPYWHGGMKDDETSWVSLQVPDGTDWLEFMLYDPTGKDKHFLGVMNHIALGVTDIHAAQEQLRKNGAPLTEEPKIGRDGKWQLNVYDPDETRIEFMEFTPVQKPCCSEFTAPHPKP